MDINFDIDKLSQVHHYLYHGINNTLNTKTFKVESNELKSIAFPGNIDVALIQGNTLLRDNSSSIQSSTTTTTTSTNSENDVYICLEMALESISTILSNTYTIMSIPSLVYVAGSKYHRRVQIIELGDSIYNFIPITILLSKIVSVIHEVDIPKKLRLAHIVNTSLAYAIQHYPMLSRDAKLRDNCELEGISFNNKLQELGMLLEEFEQLQQPKYLKSYETMRGVIPTKIFETTLKSLINDGVSPNVAQRIWHKRILWLICMHAEDIKRIHIADFRGKYSFHGLDLFEMRAVWYIIPSWEGTSEKSEWKESFKARLHELSAKEITGTLTDYEERHPAYLNCEKFDFYDAHAPLMRLHVDNVSSISDVISKPISILDADDGIVEDLVAEIGEDLQESQFDEQSDEQLLKTKLSVARKKKIKPPISKRLTVTSKNNSIKDINREYGDFLNETINEDEKDKSKGSIEEPTVDINKDHQNHNHVNSDNDSAFDEYEVNCAKFDNINEEEYDEDSDEEDEEDYDDDEEDDDNDDDDDDVSDVSFVEGVYDDYDDDEDSEYYSSNDKFEDASHYKRVPITESAKTAFGCIPTSTFANSNGSNYYNDDMSDIGENTTVIGSIISSVAVKSTVESTTSNLVYAFKSLIGGGFAEDHRAQENDDDDDDDSERSDSDRYSPETVQSNDPEESNFSQLPTMPWNEFWKKVSAARGYLSSIEEEKKIELEIDNYIVPEELMSRNNHPDDDMSVVDSIYSYQYPGIKKVETFDEFEQFATKEKFSESDNVQENFKDDSSEENFKDDSSEENFIGNSSEENFKDDSSEERFKDDSSEENFKDDSSEEDCKDDSSAHHTYVPIIKEEIDGEKLNDSDKDDDDDDDFYINSGLKVSHSYESLENKLNGRRSPGTDQTDNETTVIGEIPRDSNHASELLLKCTSNPEEIVAPIDTLVNLINIYNADVNAVDESGSTPLHFLFNKPHLGKFLVSRGANILAKDKFGDSPLSLCIEYGYDWMLPSFEATDGALKFDNNQLKEYAVLLIYGGYGSRAKDLIDNKSVTLNAEEALELMNRLHGSYYGMKEPVETYELLESLALQ